MDKAFAEKLAASRKARPPIEFHLIQIDKNIRFGKARIGNTRFTVGDLMDYLGADMSIDEIIHDFPCLTKEGIIEALNFVRAKENFDNIVLLNSMEQFKS